MCWRTTEACLACGSLEHIMVQCLRGMRDNRAPYQQPAQGQAVILAPPQQLALPAPPKQQQQQPQRQGQQRQW